MRLLTLTFLILAFWGIADAQNRAPANCPVVFVEGPKGSLKPGGTARFTIRIVPLKPEWQIKYNWTLSLGTIVSGRGTDSIVIENAPSSTLIATVDIAGTPDLSHCPRSYSEAIHWDAAPEAEKIASIRGTSIDAASSEVTRVQSEMSMRPNNQLYVFLSFKQDTPDGEVSKREAEIAGRLSAKLEKDRISIVRVPGDVDITEFWRIPPGANEPRCDGCEFKNCPLLRIFGPEGVVQPGDTADFTIRPTPKESEKLIFKWTVSAGTIIRGHDQHWIKVQTTREMNNSFLTATVEVSGISKECPSTASVAAAVSAGFHPNRVDEFRKLPVNDVKGRLDAFLNDVSGNKDHVGFIVLRYPKGVSRAKLLQRIRRISDHVFKFRKFPKERIVIFVESAGEEYTVLWRTPLEYGQYICPGCEKY